LISFDFSGAPYKVGGLPMPQNRRRRRVQKVGGGQAARPALGSTFKSHTFY